MPHEFADIGGSTRLDVTALLASDAPPQLGDDAYPAVFADQRTMLKDYTDDQPGWTPPATAQDIYDRCWVPHLMKHQKMLPRLDEENREVVPYLNQSRWVADCPACASGMACWDRNPQACCLGFGCGRLYKVLWQLPQLRSEVLRLVAGWPEGNRNWDAHKGETLDELKTQGVLMADVEPAKRNGLLVAAGVSMADELTDPTEYLDRLRKARRKVA